MSLYDYNYNDIIKAQNIIDCVRKVWDENTNKNQMDTLEFIKWNNMARECTHTWMLLEYFGEG